MSYIWAIYDMGWPFCLSRLYAVNVEHFVNFCTLGFACSRSRAIWGCVGGAYVLWTKFVRCFAMLMHPKRPSIISLNSASLSKNFLRVFGIICFGFPAFSQVWIQLMILDRLNCFMSVPLIFSGPLFLYRMDGNVSARGLSSSSLSFQEVMAPWSGWTMYSGRSMQRGLSFYSEMLSVLRKLDNTYFRRYGR